MKNYFQKSPEFPYHISIGAVLVNEEGKVCCHHFDKLNLRAIGAFEDLYLLMRETIEPGETIEGCLARGLREEFGAEGKLKAYLGSIVSRFPYEGRNEITAEKTTLYFLCDLIGIDQSNRKKDDPESGSLIEWLDPQELIQKMRDQGKRYGREDADESVVLERYLKVASKQ